MPRNVPATPASSRRAWRRFVGLVFVTAGIFFSVRTCVRRPDVDVAASPVTPPSSAVASAAPVPSADQPPLPGADANAPTTDPSVPQMRTMIFAMDSSGIHLRRSGIANGRVKAPPMSNSPRRLEFEVYGPDGAVNYSGAFDHPLWHRPEVLDDKGELNSEERSLATGSTFVRIPAELPANRIEFFDVDATSGNASRQSIGSFGLP